MIRRKGKDLRVHARHATSLQAVQNNNAEQRSTMPEVAKAHAHDLSNDALAKHLVNSGLGPTLRKLTELLPYLEELTKRFTHLRMGQTIMGYTSMNAFCLGELHRTSRAVRYALNGRTPSKKRDESEPKSFWADLANSLNELVPSSSDGVEHKVVNRIETAILKMRAGRENRAQVDARSDRLQLSGNLCDLRHLRKDARSEAGRGVFGESQHR